MFESQLPLLENILKALDALIRGLVNEGNNGSRVKVGQIEQFKEIVTGFKKLLSEEPKEKEKFLYSHFLGQLNNEIKNIKTSLQGLKSSEFVEQKQNFEEILDEVDKLGNGKFSLLNSVPVDISGLESSIESLPKCKVSPHSSPRKYSLTAAQKQACVTLAGSLFLGAAVCGIGVGVKVLLGTSVLAALAFMWPLTVAVAATALFVGLGVLLWKNDLFPRKNFLGAKLGI